MNHETANLQNKKINLMEILIPLFCIVSQYELSGISLGLICAIAAVGINVLWYREFYFYKPLFFLFLFMLFHDVLRTFVTGFNVGLWIERLSFFLFLSCVHKRAKEENLYNIWKIIGIVVMIGMFYQSFQVYILGQSVSMIKLFPFLQPGGGDYLIAYNRPHSFFLEPASYCTWILPLLYMCMKRRKIAWMIIISMSILLSTSSTGIIMTGVIWIFYAIVNASNEKRYINSLMIIGILIVGIGAFSSLSIFSMSFEKLTNISITDTSNAARLVLGFQLFWAAPLVYKILGIPYMNVESYLRSGEVSLGKYGLSLNTSYLGFVNSIGNCMLTYGVFGLFFYLKLFWNIWKESNLYSKCYVLVCFISIFGQSAFWNSFFVMQFALMLCSVYEKSFVRVKLR